MSEQMMQKSAATEPALCALVVDDTEDVAMGLTLLLRRMGYSVQVAHTAKQALEKGALARPNVVFLDIGLPDLSGYDVCKEMRRSEWGVNAYIVAVTGQNEAEDMMRAANSGFDRHVGKPMDFMTLKDILHTVTTRASFPGPGKAPSKGPRVA